MALFDFFKKKKNKAPVHNPEQIRANLIRQIEAGRLRLREIMPGRFAPTGPLAKGKTWSLSKTNYGLYRLEGSDFSILLSTEPFLMLKDEKVQGLLHISEAGLARAMKDKSSFVAFFGEARAPLSGRSFYRKFLSGNESHGVSMEQLGKLSALQLEQFIAACGPALLCHVLVATPEDLSGLLIEHTSLRFRMMLVDELEVLSGKAADARSNPHSQRIALEENDRAMELAFEKLRRLLDEARLEQEREERRRRGLELPQRPA